jgi:hypothetical protein
MDTNMMELASSFILEDALVLIPVLWIIGYFLKQSNKVADWVIPWILIGLGIAGSIGLMGFSVQAIIQGVLVSGASVLGHQVIKQTTSKK